MMMSGGIFEQLEELATKKLAEKFFDKCDRIDT